MRSIIKLLILMTSLTCLSQKEFNQDDLFFGELEGVEENTTIFSVMTAKGRETKKVDTIFVLSKDDSDDCNINVTVENLTKFDVHCSMKVFIKYEFRKKKLITLRAGKKTYINDLLRYCNLKKDEIIIDIISVDLKPKK